MEFETYGDVIDAFERDNMGYDTLTDYIRGENIKIAEIDMDPIGDFAKIFNKKDGGMMIAIEQLGKGGITGGKTYHQYHDQFVPPDSESQMYANGGGVGSMMQPKKKNFKMQGGVRNYLGNQKQVKAPLKWQSSPDHPTTELAYITKKEKDLLVKSDLHGSLKGRVNKGPSGIMSLNGYGSRDPSQNVSGVAASAAESGSTNARDRAEVRAEFGRGVRGPALPPGVTPKTAQDFRNAAIVAGAGQRVNPGFFDSRNTISPQELALARASDPRTFNKIRGTGGIMGFIKSGGFFGNLLRGLGQKFGLGKTYDQPTYDMSEFSDYGIGGTPPGTLDFDSNAKIQNTSFINQKPTANIQGTNLNDFEIGNPGKYATADMINEFGVKAGTADDSIANLSSLPGSADDRFANMYEDPFGNPTNDSRVVSEEMGLQGDGSIQNQNFMNQDYGIIKSGKTIQEQFPVRSDFNVTKTLTPQGYEFVDNFQTNYMQETGKLPNSPFLGYNEALQDPNNYTIDPSNLRVDASTNTNKQLLENIINKDMFEKNLEPAINNQNKKNNILEQMLLEESTLT